MRRAVFVPAMLAGLGAAAASGAPVDFQLVSQSVQVDKASSTSTFTILFNQTPDFSGNANTKQPDAFQYEIDPSWNGETVTGGISFEQIATVVRGSEIWEGAGLPIRNRDGNGGEFAGGWGPVRALVPVQVNGDTLSFTTKLGDIGDSDGIFRYRLFTSDHGTVTSDVTAVSIPLPAALGTGLTMLGGMGMSRKLRRRRR